MTVLEELKKMLGPDLTVKFLTRYGGRRLYIPKEIGDNHELYWWLGKYAHRLSEYYGGCHLDLPLARKEVSRLRRKRIVELRRQGKSVQSIVSILGCSRRWVQTVLAEEKEKEKVSEGMRQLGFGGFRDE